ncbi:MAG: undecaprenyl diphosphate synthase family protein [Methanothrix sp.]|nr:undecaprenyl diphosphate synthase family protein [Methanothrix sp.]
MIYRLYERLLQERIAKSNLPGCVAVVLSSGDLFEDGLVRLSELLEWCRSIGLTSLVLYVNDDAPLLCRKIVSQLAASPAQISLHTREGVEQTGSGGPLKVVISLGYGGKREVAEAFRDLLRDVEMGQLHPEQIDEKTIESHLRFSQKPDLVIRAGGKRLSDFLIWQAAYSELYFTDVNWRELRKIDFLRAIRDCQRRERRFGR